MVLLLSIAPKRNSHKPRHKGSGTQSYTSKATLGQEPDSDNDEPGSSRGSEINYAISPPQGSIPKKQMMIPSIKFKMLIDL